jgi:hypothetical protein
MVQQQHQQLRETNALLNEELQKVNTLSRSNRRLEIANETAIAAHQEFPSYTTELKHIQQKFKEESKAAKQRLERMEAKWNFVDMCYKAESNSSRVYEEVLFSKILRRVSSEQQQECCASDVLVLQQEIHKVLQECSKEVLESRTRGVSSAGGIATTTTTSSASASALQSDEYDDGDDEASYFSDSDSQSSWWNSDDESVGSFCSVDDDDVDLFD